MWEVNQSIDPAFIRFIQTKVFILIVILLVQLSLVTSLVRGVTRQHKNHMMFVHERCLFIFFFVRTCVKLPTGGSILIERRSQENEILTPLSGMTKESQYPVFSGQKKSRPRYFVMTFVSISLKTGVAPLHLQFPGPSIFDCLLLHLS